MNKENHDHIEQLEEEKIQSSFNEKIVLKRISEIEKKIKKENKFNVFEEKKEKKVVEPVFEEKKDNKVVEELQLSKTQIEDLQKANKNLEKTIEDMKKKAKNEQELSDKTIELLQNTIEGMSLNKEIVNKEYQKTIEIELNAQSEIIHIQLLNQFSNDIIRYIEHTFDEHYNSFPRGALKELINSIQNVEPIQDTLSNMIQSEEAANHIDFLSNEMKHYNILVIGSSGVGKTTLIKSVLKLNDSERGKSTEGFQSYESTGIRLWDTKGIKTIEDTEKEFTQFINAKIEKGNIDEFIHCIWYCVTGEQFSEKEREFIHKLSSLYKENNIPVIIVYTKAIDDITVEEMKKHIMKKEEKNYSFSFIPVIAKDITRKKKKKISVDKSEGLDELIKKSQKKMENIPYFACITSVYNKIERGFYDIIEKRRSNCLNFIPEISGVFNSISEKLREHVLLICNDIVSKMIYGVEDSLKIDTIELLSSFFDDTFVPWVNKLFLKIKDNYINEKGKLVELELCKLELLICKKYNVVLQKKEKDKNYIQIIKNLQDKSEKKIYELLSYFLCPEITEMMYQMMKEKLNYSLAKCQKRKIKHIINEVMGMPKNLNIKIIL